MPRQVLVVDDEEVVAESIGMLLSDAGYEVTISTDAYDALEKVAAGSYDLITMDLRMPRLDGVQATKQIMDLMRLRRISTPVVIISAYVSDFREKLRQIPVRHILQKPIDKEDLLEAVRQAIEDGQRAIPDR